MNKKKLSVVMAGAMLASSAVPVLSQILYRNKCRTVKFIKIQK